MVRFVRLRTAAVGLAVAAVALAGALGFGGPARQAHALSNCTVADMTVDSQEAAFLTLINNYRAQNGLGALTLSTNLNRSASWLAIDMANKNYFSHSDSLGRSPASRAIDCGYPMGAGENIAAGTVWDTAQEAFDAWRNSAGHNANMLNASYKQIGIARYYGSGSTYGWYWVTDFGTVNDGTSGSGGSTGGGATVTPAKANLTSPTPGSRLSGASQAFGWDSGAAAQEYFFYAGTWQGANNLYGQSTGLNRGVTIGNLPTNGSTIYIRLWTRLSTGWQYNDYTFTAASLSGGATASKAAITSPAAGSLLPSGRNTFSWNAGSGAQEYFFYLGTVQGANNLYGQSQGLGRSLTLNVPYHTSPLWVRLWTRLPTGWQYTDYQYR